MSATICRPRIVESQQGGMTVAWAECKCGYKSAKSVSRGNAERSLQLHKWEQHL